MSERYEYATKSLDGTWTPCDTELNAWLDRATAVLGGQPLSVVAFDDEGAAHVIKGVAYHVLTLALLAMDARLRPSGCYRDRADEVYAVLATGHDDGVTELRRAFRLGAQRPWLVE